MSHAKTAHPSPVQFCCPYACSSKVHPKASRAALQRGRPKCNSKPISNHGIFRSSRSKNKKCMFGCIVSDVSNVLVGIWSGTLIFFKCGTLKRKD